MRKEEEGRGDAEEGMISTEEKSNRKKSMQRSCERLRRG
jgi:hypothetical protein